MEKNRTDWRLVMVVRNGRIHTARYKITGGLVTVKYDNSTKSAKCTNRAVIGQQAEKLLREIVKIRDCEH